ncbi:MAG: tyrosine-type recombinase/integrase [Deltaproteobacteria bacterium]|nr:tyrosine-type recombinase/integrase [bacterium]MDE0343968.1 tyrosine-type recombinase/integrase [Deltaproteobacteria bacterium]
MAATRLTQARIRALRPRKTARDIRDAELKGFGVRLYPNGRACFFIHSQHEGKRVWKIVGDAASLSVEDARTRARSMLAADRHGTSAASEHPLFDEVAEEVFRRYGRNWKPRTLAVNRGYFANQILPWFQGRPIADVTAADVREWFASLHATPVAADRSAPVLSVIMDQAEAYGYRPQGSNPCKGIRRYRRKGRERFLSAEEVRRLGRALRRHEGHARRNVAIIRLLLLTGCRGREVATLRWREYRDRHLHLEDSKAGPRMVWLSSPARRILDRQPRTSPWVFPSKRTGRSVDVDAVGKFWRHLRLEAGLHDVRLHDLRHTYASIAVMTGENVLTVGRLLGHNDPGTTLKYTHLADDAVARAAETMGPVLASTLS